MECENILFIHFDEPAKKDYFLETFTNSEKLFEGFINYFSTKLETYGTDSDVYNEYVEIEMCSDDMVKLVFYTHKFPCIEFCRRFSWVYSLNTQLIYYNQEADFSGRFSMFRNQNTLDEKYNYLQGLYTLDNDRFWEEAKGFYNMNFHIDIPASDRKRLRELVHYNQMINNFENL